MKKIKKKMTRLIATMVLMAVIGGPAAIAQTGGAAGSPGRGKSGRPVAKPRSAIASRGPTRFRRRKI